MDLSSLHYPVTLVLNWFDFVINGYYSRTIPQRAELGMGNILFLNKKLLHGSRKKISDVNFRFQYEVCVCFCFPLKSGKGMKYSGN